jgi:hypothetical protein
MDLTIDEARLLVSDAVLWPRMRDFLWDFAPQIDASWLAELPLDGMRNEPRVKAWLLHELAVEPCFHTFPKEDMSRLALLDGATLLELVKWLGALDNAEALRRVTSGAQVRSLKAALPGVYPEVFQYTAYFRLADEGAVVTAPEVLIEAGMGMLLAALEAAPEPVIARMRLKLPKALSGVVAGKKPADGALKKLLKLKFREAYTLCC